MKLLNGLELANKLNKISKQQLEVIFKKENKFPVLGIVVVGNKYASKIYIRNKIKKCNFLGVKTKLFEFSENISQNELVSNLQKINKDNNISSYIVQFPLPKHISKEIICNNVALSKDADGLSTTNKSLLLKNNKNMLIPCTPNAIFLLLEHYNINYKNKNIVIIGKGDIVGKPLFTMFGHIPCKSLNICDKSTLDIIKYTKIADILVSATGKIHLINNNMIKDNVVLIDVGITFDANNKIAGDINFEDVKKRPGYVTPVPNGIGPITISCLIQNIIKLYNLKH